eukprot:440331-Karenia_brevis.AAC.1
MTPAIRANGYNTIAANSLFIMFAFCTELHILRTTHYANLVTERRQHQITLLFITVLSKLTTSHTRIAISK